MKTNHFSFHCLLLTLSACSLILIPLDAQKPQNQKWYHWDDFHFYYSMPISSYASLDTLDMYWETIFKKVGEEKTMPLGKAFIGTQESTQNRIYEHRPDMSYKAETSYLNGKDANFLQLYVMYPLYGMGMQFEKVCKKWVDLYKSKNVDVSYDFYAKNMEVWNITKEEAMELRKEMWSLLRKVDLKHLWYREDLSYNPGD